MHERWQANDRVARRRHQFYTLNVVVMNGLLCSLSFSSYFVDNDALRLALERGSSARLGHTVKSSDTNFKYCAEQNASKMPFGESLSFEIVLCLIGYLDYALNWYC